MPDYLLLIYEDENRWENAGPETLADVLAGHGAFAEKHGTSIRGGHALQPTATATCVRHDLDGGALSPTEPLPRPRRPWVATT